MLHYCERLNKLGAETLEMRRLKLNLVMFYNILHGFVELMQVPSFTPLTVMLSVWVWYGIVVFNVPLDTL